MLAVEDKRFYTHIGFDPLRIGKAFFNNLIHQEITQGGSTITQQLAKNLFPRDINENRGKIARTTKLVVSKLKEWITALKLEYNYTKEEIAAMYLNTVEFGSNAYGIKSRPTPSSTGTSRTEHPGSRPAGGTGQGPTMYSPA